MNTIPKLTSYTMYTIRIKQSSHGYNPETQIHAPATEIIKSWFLETNSMLHDKNNICGFSINAKPALEQIKDICKKTDIMVEDLAKALEWSNTYRKFILFNAARGNREQINLTDFLHVQTGLSKIQDRQIQDEYKKLISQSIHPEKATYILEHMPASLLDNKDTQLIVELPDVLPDIVCKVHIKSRYDDYYDYNMALSLESAGIRNYIQNCILIAIDNMDTDALCDKNASLKNKIQHQINVHGLENKDNN